MLPWWSRFFQAKERSKVPLGPRQPPTRPGSWVSGASCGTPQPGAPSSYRHRTKLSPPSSPVVFFPFFLVWYQSLLHFQSSGGSLPPTLCPYLSPLPLTTFSPVFYLAPCPDGLAAALCLTGNPFEGSCSITSSHSHVLQETCHRSRRKTPTADLHSPDPDSPSISLSFDLKGRILCSLEFARYFNSVFTRHC